MRHRLRINSVRFDLVSIKSDDAKISFILMYSKLRNGWKIARIYIFYQYFQTGWRKMQDWKYQENSQGWIVRTAISAFAPLTPPSTQKCIAKLSIFLGIVMIKSVQYSYSSHRKKPMSLNLSFHERYNISQFFSRITSKRFAMFNVRLAMTKKRMI